MMCLVVSMSITVYAESGKVYKTVGATYPIYVEDKILKSDLPILNYKGSTYLPLRKVSEAVDANISWDDIDKRVLIFKNNNESKTLSEIQRLKSDLNITKSDLDRTKTALNQSNIDLQSYKNKNIEDISILKKYALKLGEYQILMRICGMLPFRISMISTMNMLNSGINGYEDSFNIAINIYNSELESLKLAINRINNGVSTYGDEYNTMVEIANEYNSALVCYSNSIDGIKNSLNRGIPIYAPSIQQYIDDGLKYESTARDKAFNSYVKISDLVQNYK